MAPRPGSPYDGLPIHTVTGPDGEPRRVVSLRLTRSDLPAPGRHLVTRGEGVDLLARRYYGAEGLWWRILDANPVVHPLDIEAGDVLALPEQAPATRVSRAREF